MLPCTQTLLPSHDLLHAPVATCCYAIPWWHVCTLQPNQNPYLSKNKKVMSLSVKISSGKPHSKNIASIWWMTLEVSCWNRDHQTVNWTRPQSIKEKNSLPCNGLHPYLLYSRWQADPGHKIQHLLHPGMTSLVVGGHYLDASMEAIYKYFKGSPCFSMASSQKLWDSSQFVCLIVVRLDQSNTCRQSVVFNKLYECIEPLLYEHQKPTDACTQNH